MGLTINGTNEPDTLQGTLSDDHLLGLGGSDAISAGEGADLLIGVDVNSDGPGLGEIDSMTGGFGPDLFVLGDATQVYYDDGNETDSGYGDYGLIVDFNASEGDLIQLHGFATGYTFVSSPAGLPSGTAISRNGELVGIIKDVDPNSIPGESISYVTDNIDIDIDSEQLGGPGNDELIGGDGNDLLNGAGGDDALQGRGGNDLLFGGEGNDLLEGNNEDDTLYGGPGADQLLGGNGNDTLIGIDPDSTPLGGIGEIDQLQGDGDSDLFVLGDTNHVYYDDDDILSAGLSDYALIVDFDVIEGDIIQLNGDSSDYVLGSSPSGLPSGTAIFYTSGQNEDELIGIIQGNQTLNVDNLAVFQYV